MCTLAELKAELGITDTTDDTALTELIKGLQGRFEGYCSRRFERSVGVTALFDGGTKYICLPRWPVESVASVKIDADGDFTSPDETLTENDDFYLKKERGILAFAGDLWPEGVDHIQVVWTGGFVAAGTTVQSGQYEMPYDLRRALFMQAGFEWRNRRSLGAASVSSNGQSMTIAPAQLLPEVTAALFQLRRII